MEHKKICRIHITFPSQNVAYCSSLYYSRLGVQLLIQQNSEHYKGSAINLKGLLHFSNLSQQLKPQYANEAITGIPFNSLMRNSDCNELLEHYKYLCIMQHEKKYQSSCTTLPQVSMSAHSRRASKIQHTLILILCDILLSHNTEREG